MLTPQQFTSRWKSEVVAKSVLPEELGLLTVTAQALASARLPERALRFLVEAGLPESCAPFLGFEEVGKDLPRIWEVYSPGQWRPEEKLPLEHYLMLGAEGSGNPICVDERDGTVVMVDHEVLFDSRYRDRLTTFVNSGIPELAECLLVFETSPPETCLDALGQVDPPAVRKGAFWFSEANALVEPKRPWWKLW